GRDRVRGDRPGPPAGRLLHERARPARLRADRERRHTAHRSAHGHGLPDGAADLPAPELGTVADDERVLSLTDLSTAAMSGVRPLTWPFQPRAAAVSEAV